MENKVIKDFLSQSVVLIFSLVMAVLGLLIYNFQIIGLPDIWRFIVSSTLVLGGLFILVENLFFRINAKIEQDTRKVESKVKDLRQGIDSTVKTMQFFGRANGGSAKISNVRMGTEPIRIIDEVAQGSIDMRLLQHFKQSESTALLVEGSRGSVIKEHTQPQFAHIYVIEGMITIRIEEESPVTIQKGETIKIDNNVRKSITFNENSTTIFTLTPALDDWVEGKMEVGRLS